MQFVLNTLVRNLYALLTTAGMLGALLCPLFSPMEVQAATVVLRDGLNNYEGTDDASIYEDRRGNSNGGLRYFFAGVNAQNSPRRSLLRFDLTGQLPANAVVTGVALEIVVDRSREASTTHTLHRITRGWGEGTVDSGNDGGAGATAMPGDATWLTARLNEENWTNAGGDFVTSASGEAFIGLAGAVGRFEGPGLVRDVQGWIENPATNFGWMLRGDETGYQNAKRFLASENGGDQIPTLTIQYTLRAPARPGWNWYQ